MSMMSIGIRYLLRLLLLVAVLMPVNAKSEEPSRAQFVDPPVEARVGIHIRDDDRFARSRRLAGDARLRAEAQLLNTGRDLAVELIPFAVVEKHARAVAVQRAQGRLLHALQQLVQIKRAAEVARDLDHHRKIIDRVSGRVIRH